MAIIDRRFLDARLTIQGIVKEPGGAVTPYEGLQYIVAEDPTGDFASATKDQIAIYEGGAWKFYDPKATGLEVIDASDGKIYGYDGTEWKVVVDLVTSEDLVDSFTDVHEVHTLTAAEATAKAFDLNRVVKEGQEGSVIAFLEGVCQYPGTDFTVATASNKSTLTWTASIQLMEGDKFVVVYKTQNTDA